MRCCGSRAQAIGRVIRHRGDYGAILLCDQRFGSADLIQQLSAWVRPRVQTFSKFGLLPRDLGNFFRTVEPLFPASQRVAKPKVASIKTGSNTSSSFDLKTVSSFFFLYNHLNRFFKEKKVAKWNRKSYETKLNPYRLY